MNTEKYIYHLILKIIIFKKKIKHDQYIEDLCEKIKSDYDSLSTNISFYSSSKKPRPIGEVDILAYKDGFYDAYEVKCSYRKYKAKKQLLKIKKNIPNIRNLFFFCAESGTLEEIV